MVQVLQPSFSASSHHINQCYSLHFLRPLIKLTSFTSVTSSYSLNLILNSLFSFFRDMWWKPVYLLNFIHSSVSIFWFGCNYVMNLRFPAKKKCLSYLSTRFTTAIMQFIESISVLKYFVIIWIWDSIISSI